MWEENSKTTKNELLAFDSDLNAIVISGIFQKKN